MKKKRMKLVRDLRSVTLAAGAVFLVGCSLGGGTDSPYASATLPAPETLAVVPTDTPLAPEASAILVAGPSTDAGLLASVQAALESYANEAGLAVEQREGLTAADLTEAVQVVVALPPDPGVAELVAAASSTRFVSVGITGLTAGGNLTVIGGQGSGADKLGFLAGYMAAIITNEWRAGALATSDAEGTQARVGFQRGVRYFCGLCQQTYAPFYSYEESPLYVELPAGSGQAEWQAAADSLISRSIRTIYVAPGAGDVSLLQYLAVAGIQIIGSVTVPEGVEGNWVASVGPDYTSGLMAALRGEVSGDVSMGVAITSVNPQLLSPGKLEYVMNILDDLLGGYIDTGS